MSSLSTTLRLYRRYHHLIFRCHKSSLSTMCNFRQTVNANKEEARKFVVIENLCHEPGTKTKIAKIDLSFLCEKFNTELDAAWMWSYHRRNFFLLQLKSVTDVRAIQDRCCFGAHSFPIRSRMLETSLNLTAAKVATDESRISHRQFVSSPLQKSMLPFNEMRKKFSSPQLIEYLTANNSLTDFDIRLRYFLITQLEEILCEGVFSDFHIFPFGSSLAGLGDSSSDLDIVLLHRNLRHQSSSDGLNFSIPEIRSDRDQMQLSLSLIADIARNFMPHFSQINRILRARVPIVKMTYDLAPIDIDISIELSEETGHHGFIMANYLAYCISVDHVVKQFFVLLKNWAKQHGIVKTIAGNWFTNFQIIALAIYFLQHKNHIRSIDAYENVKATDQPPLVPLPHFHKLLYEFFEFIVSFNFEKEAISILQAKSFSKPDFAPLYIENPIERNLNICKNVNGLEFKKLLLLAYNSLDAMHNEQFHLADLLDAEYFKQLEKQSQSSA